MKKIKKNRIRLWAVAVWIVLWQLAAVLIGEGILIAGPYEVLQKLVHLTGEAAFWKSVFFSFGKIFSGFLLALIFGIFFAVIASESVTIREFLAPFITVQKTVPVASFVILVLLWAPSENLSIIISFIMVFPILYTNTLQGILSIEKNMTEMADVFRVPFTKRIRYLYLPYVLPYIKSACIIALGLCWKAGIAAEVIGIPEGSIGEKLYKAKVYFQTADLFAWTCVIILLSLLVEKIFMRLLEFGIRWAEGGMRRGYCNSESK